MMLVENELPLFERPAAATGFNIVDTIYIYVSILVDLLELNESYV